MQKRKNIFNIKRIIHILFKIIVNQNSYCDSCAAWPIKQHIHTTTHPQTQNNTPIQAYVITIQTKANVANIAKSSIIEYIRVSWQYLTNTGEIINTALEKYAARLLKINFINMYRKITDKQPNNKLKDLNPSSELPNTLAHNFNDQ